MKWNTPLFKKLHWSGEISRLEQKQKVAEHIASRLRDGDIVGIGSGSTAFVALQALAERSKKEGLKFTAIPTSAEITLACAVLNVPTTTLLDARPDWALDGADEVDKDRNLLKGRGGAMFKEKLNIISSPENYILIDKSKRVDRLGKRFPIPVEIYPESLPLVESALLDMGASEVVLRLAEKKDGPVITESGNFILDVRFPEIKATLERDLKQITGVIESGLFIGYDIKVVVEGEF